VFEKSDRIGGLLRYGIPNFKMEKHLIDRRLEQMRREGVEFVVNAHIGVNKKASDLRDDFHAIVLAGGAEHPARSESAGARTEEASISPWISCRRLIRCAKAIRCRIRFWPPASVS
jgi:NADPH-dependent glutamate synthase beta subunit-like oxidoreductase